MPTSPLQAYRIICQQRPAIGVWTTVFNYLVPMIMMMVLNMTLLPMFGGGYNQSFLSAAVFVTVEHPQFAEAGIDLVVQKCQKRISDPVQNAGHQHDRPDHPRHHDQRSQAAAHRGRVEHRVQLSCPHDHDDGAEQDRKSVV